MTILVGYGQNTPHLAHYLFAIPWACPARRRLLTQCALPCQKTYFLVKIEYCMIQFKPADSSVKIKILTIRIQIPVKNVSI